MPPSIDFEVAKPTCPLQCVLTASRRLSDAPATTHLPPAHHNGLYLSGTLRSKLILPSTSCLGDTIL